jgi:hypothetical protein
MLNDCCPATGPPAAQMFCTWGRTDVASRAGAREASVTDMSFASLEAQSQRRFPCLRHPALLIRRQSSTYTALDASSGPWAPEAAIDDPPGPSRGRSDPMSREPAELRGPFGAHLSGPRFALRPTESAPAERMTRPSLVVGTDRLAVSARLSIIRTPLPVAVRSDRTSPL